MVSISRASFQSTQKPKLNTNEERCAMNWDCWTTTTTDNGHILFHICVRGPRADMRNVVVHQALRFSVPESRCDLNELELNSIHGLSMQPVVCKYKSRYYIGTQGLVRLGPEIVTILAECDASLWNDDGGRGGWIGTLNEITRTDWPHSPWPVSRTGSHKVTSWNIPSASDHPSCLDFMETTRSEGRKLGIRDGISSELSSEVKLLSNEQMFKL